MPKNSQQGNIALILILVFVTIGGIAAFTIYKTLSKTAEKLNQSSDAVTVALKRDYQNPLDKDAQYVNPFSSYKNPFDNLK